jgi:drug/metabolite transporter (DMT)-like permease
MKSPGLNNRVLLGYVSALVTAVLLGFFPSVTKPIMSYSSPIFFSAIVQMAPIIVFTPLIVVAGRRKLTTTSQTTPRRIYWIVLISTLVGAIIGPLAYFFGLRTTQASDATLLQNGEMVFTIVFASIVFREKLNSIGLLALILVAVGLVVVVTNLHFSSTLLNLTDPGHLLILASGVCWGLDNNLITYASTKIDVSRFIQIRGVISGPILLVIAYFLSALPSFGSGNSVYSELLYIVFVGILLFGGALYFNFLALKELGAIRTTLIFPISSIFGLFAAYVLLNEVISIYQIVSVGVIFLGIFLLMRTGSVTKQYSYDIP